MLGKYVLCMDIGGTNVRIAMIDVSEAYKIMLRWDIHSSQIKSIVYVVNSFLKEAGEKGYTTDTCVISMAGPIENNACIFPPHVPFSVDGEDIRKHSYLKNVLLINDFSAVCFGVLTMDTKDHTKIMTVFDTNTKKQNNNVAVIGAGTGLGVGYITCKNGEYTVNESEGGHIAFDFVDLSNSAFANFLRTNKIYNYDALVTGPGIKKLTMFHKADFDKDIFYEISLSKDITAKVCEMYDKDKACKKVIQKFMYFYGKFAQHMALAFLPKGGLFLAGGVIQKNIDFLGDGVFIKSFLNHPTMANVLDKIPIFVVLEKDVALYGCAKAATQMFK